MKMTLAMLLAIGACVAAEDPEVGTRQQDERIEVHACRPGYHEVDEGNIWRCVLDQPLGGGADDGPHHGGERTPGGGRGAPGGGGNGGGPYPTSDPNVLIYYSTIGGSICRSMCALLSLTVCATITLACQTATTVTIGAMVIPCTHALLAACVAGPPVVTQWCSDWLCPA
jgi:hypothetical protein